MKCPHCKKEIESQQARAAASRWAKLTPAQRGKAMARVRAGKRKLEKDR